jgi:hypothetical protein
VKEKRGRVFSERDRRGGMEDRGKREVKRKYKESKSERRGGREKKMIVDIS